FMTNNAGASGSQGQLNDVEENTLSSKVATNPLFIDVNAIATDTDAVGDANVMTTFDPNWCLDLSATNRNNVTGPVHVYAQFSGAGGHTGLIIYNGLDVDSMPGADTGSTGARNLRKLYVQELQQPFDPSGLPCGVPVVGISIAPDTASNPAGTS